MSHLLRGNNYLVWKEQKKERRTNIYLMGGHFTYGQVMVSEGGLKKAKHLFLGHRT